jgi:Ser/Thr protein kinase RdoA (MazF antagonist)
VLKNKIKTLDKRIKQLSKSKTNGVFFVGIQEGKYIVKLFTQKYDEDSIFIIDDIPREVNGTNLFDWID